MRCTGCLTVRPRPLEDFSDNSIEVGAAVDAWWSDGWWEGVVMEYDVFVSGENRILEFRRINVRIPRDWIDNKWVEVKGKRDIKLLISSSLTDVSQCSSNSRRNCKDLTAPMRKSQACHL